MAESVIAQAYDVTQRLIPANPERDCYHWVRRYKSAPLLAMFWHANLHENVGKGWGGLCQPDRETEWEYYGPCLPPDGVVTRWEDYRA